MLRKGKGTRKQAEREVDPDGLSAKERAFVTEYVKDWNATQAMMRVDPRLAASDRYDYARIAGYRMITKINVRDAYLKIEKDRRTKLSVEDVDDMLRAFAEVDATDLFNEFGDLKPLSEIPPRARRAIASIEVEERTRGRGEDVEMYKVKTVRMVDKRAAAELLGKHRKMFTDRVQLEGNAALPVQLIINAAD
jgi:phage terminase small subunit